MSLLDKFQQVAEQRAQLGDADPSKVVIEKIISPTEAQIAGRHTILAGTNATPWVEHLPPARKKTRPSS